MGLYISPLTLFDTQNLLTFIPFLNKKIEMNGKKEEDYTILVTTYNSNIPLKNIHFLRQYKEKVIICDDGSRNSYFLEYLKQLEKEGFRVVRNGKKKYMKWEFLKRVISEPSREVALKEGLKKVQTKYTIFLDDDSVPEGDLGYAVNCLEETDADLASVKIFPINQNNLIENLQTIEYAGAMLAREIRPYLTSGACLIGKTTSLRKIMDSHSMFYQGGDIEIGVLAKKLGMKVIHVKFNVFTEVPNTFFRWFKQRCMWASGNFRHTVINFWNYLKFDPLHIFYFTFMIWILLYFKWKTNFAAPLFIFLVLLIYIPITIISNLKIIKEFKDKKWWFYFLIFPIYALIQVLIIIPTGIFIYLNQALIYKNWGIIKERENEKN